ncbi:MAG: hypothetical protein BWZ02_00786 [Lentisphaerae bacterium ADurb.BinA184]|nr:MAG: hypothetical protein BWZ02_00786 [Lentisphaerae bacterium ADurb.BinA184]
MLDAHGNPLPMPPMVDAKGNPIPMPPMLDAQGRPMMMPGEVDAQGRPIPPRQATKPTPGARPALPRFLQPGGQQPEPGTPDQSPPPVEPGTAPDPDAETVAAAPDATAEIPADAPREVTLGAPSMPPPEGLAPAGAPPPPPLPRAPTVPPPPAPPPQETGGGSAWKWMAAVGVAILGLIVLGVVMSDSLLKGKGKARCVATKEDAEKRFWAKAGQDPARCPFCAYAFPSEEEANTALSGLSFMGQDSRDPGGRLVSAEPITFGVYPDGGEFVAFVGGAALNYRLWREAREVLGKGREYRLSPPPAPAAEVPTVPGIDHVSDSEGEPGDFCFYRRYRAPDKMAAMAFLAQVKIKAAGVEVVVETPEGDCARNLAGIRELE